MNPSLTSRLERALVRLFAASFTLPLILGGVLLFPRTHVPATAWLRNATLVGVQNQPIEVKFSRLAVLSAKYQDAFAQNYNFHFAGRELLIRLIGEMYLHVFHKTFVDMLVGPQLALVPNSYAEDYCLRRIEKDTLRPLAEHLRRIQDFCDARGIAFALVITPNKASIYPENLPANWLRRYQPGERGYERFLPLLQEKGIRYVDGHQITAELKPTAEVPVFPRGSGHWGVVAALATTNALLEVLAKHGLSVQPIQDYRTSVSNHPSGEDSDTADLLNVVFPMHYPVATMTILPSPRNNANPSNIVFVGGSFLERMLEALDGSRQFLEMEHYFYYKRGKRSWERGERHEISTPTLPLNFETDIFAADALVLEVNEEALCVTMSDHLEVDHLETFLRDAFRVLPDPHSPKAPFHYENWIDYHWGDTISFLANGHAFSAAALSGFVPFTPAGGYTVGPVSTLRLRVPPVAEDMVLTLEAIAFLVDTRLPEQRVSVYANGHEVGEWLWKAGTPPHHELVISKDFLGGGTVKLEFHVANPSSPAEFGLSADVNKYGIIVSTVRLHAARE